MRSEEIYEALFDEEAFRRLPDLLCEAAGARSAMLLWQHPDGAQEAMAYNYFPGSMMDLYGAQWSSLDPWVIGGLRSGRENEMVLLEPYVSSHIFERSVFYNEFVRAQNDDTFQCAGGLIFSAWGRGIISAQKGKSQPRFGEDDAERLQRAAVHVERVIRARVQLSAARRAASFAQTALDATGLVAITVRADCVIVHSNEGAERVFGRGDGLIRRGGRLSGADVHVSRRLDAALAKATANDNPTATALIIERGPDEPAYLATVTPLVGQMSEPAALILFRDPDSADSGVAERLRTLFGLTNAEAAVVVDLAGGLALRDIARNRAVQVSTLRSQLKSIARKTGCSRQAELVALVGRIVPLAGAHPPFGR